MSETMATMVRFPYSSHIRCLPSYQVATPYVNHVPTMTGGIGHNDLARFYKVSTIYTGLRGSHMFYSIISQRFA